MNQDERERLLIDKTCALLAGRLANSKCTLSPSGCITEHFEKTYKALAAEFKKGYISQSAK